MQPYYRPLPTLAEQAWRLRIAQPSSSVRFDRRGNRMIWIGQLQPTVLSNNYTARIEYTRQLLRPRILIAAPTLVERDGEDIPHVYGDGSLCLWQPAYQEWRPAYWIAETIIGWASLWLFFYELWHACGDWLGGGEHPPETDNELGEANERNQ